MSKVIFISMENLFEEIMLKNKKCYFSTTMSLCNTQKHHGFLVSKINNQFVKVVSNLIEKIYAYDNIYDLTFKKYSNFYDIENKIYQNLPKIDNNVFKTCYSMGPILIEKLIKIDKFDNKISVEYRILECCSNIKLIIKPLFAFTNIFYCSKKRNLRNLSINDFGDRVNIQTNENFVNLDMFFNKEYQLMLSNDWITNVELSDARLKNYEDLFCPVEFSFLINKDDCIKIDFKLDEFYDRNEFYEFEEAENYSF